MDHVVLISYISLPAKIKISWRKIMIKLNHFFYTLNKNSGLKQTNFGLKKSIFGGKNRFFNHNLCGLKHGLNNNAEILLTVSTRVTIKTRYKYRAHIVHNLRVTVNSYHPNPWHVSRHKTTKQPINTLNFLLCLLILFFWQIKIKILHYIIIDQNCIEMIQNSMSSIIIY